VVLTENAAGKLKIETGAGDDLVGTKNIQTQQTIITGAGNDTVINQDVKTTNTLQLGSGNNTAIVNTTAGLNKVFSGDGDDKVLVSGDKNLNYVFTGAGNNQLAVGPGADSITRWGDPTSTSTLSLSGKSNDWYQAGNFMLNTDTKSIVFVNGKSFTTNARLSNTSPYRRK
jgi:Ca2+-binding RTX toxin-like protein